LLDLLIRNGRIVDGTGNPWYRGDVAVSGDRVSAVGDLGAEPAARIIDADGLVVCPGFIDIHAHSDLQLLVNPAHEAKVHQGVTLDVIGQDGLSYAPVTDSALAELQVQLAGWNGNPEGFDWDWRTVGQYLDRFDRTGIAINIAFLVPHGTLRMDVVGLEDRPATQVELAEMQRLLADSLGDGAVGLSAGLTYAPGMYASDEELVALCEVMGSTNRFYCPHHRSYGTLALQAYADCIEIARKAGVPLHLPHAHMAFPVNRGRSPELLALIDEARATGVDVSLDVYPYTAGNTYLHAILPGWMHSGGPAQTLGRLRQPELRDQLRAEIEELGSDGHYGVPIDWSKVVINGVRRSESKRWVGVTVADAAELTGQRRIDFYCDLLVTEELGASVILHNGNEEDVRTIMAHPAHAAGSDGALVGDRPHPRAWGTFPRYLGHYVRELGLVRLEEMVRKMTSLPAQRLGFGDRGLLRPGMGADIVCFDPDTIRDMATYDDPRQLPEGIPYVIVNGRPVVDDGRHTGNLPGRALRRTGFRFAKWQKGFATSAKGGRSRAG
jgi:N-acyl-D-amino-acid deacylase